MTEPNRHVSVKIQMARSKSAARRDAKVVMERKCRDEGGHPGKITYKDWSQTVGSLRFFYCEASAPLIPW